MEINKRCISAFAKNGPFVALATKSKLFDPTFSLTSELILVNYMTGQTYPAITTELKFCKILWCEFGDKNYLVAGHENGYISIYERQEEGLVLVKTKECLQDDIVALDFLYSKSVLVAASSKGKIIFWTLSNLDKEFVLDVPLPNNISAISCNPKVFKILCVGTSDGIIKVVDIKKLSVILTLNGKEFNEVKQLEWDLENNTKLRVMSEKGYISVFDLSNDSVAQIGNHSESLIGFQGSTLVSKTQIESNGFFIPIAESFECAISSRDPVIALSHNTGSTRIVSIPMLIKKVPFCGIQNIILSKENAYKVSFENTFEFKEDNTFYDELIAKVNSENGCQDVAGFLLENSVFTMDEEENLDIEVDMADQFTKDLIRNNFENLKNSTLQVELSVLDVFRTKDLSIVGKLTSFPVVMVLCKLLNDFSSLSRLKNPRILAAIILNHKIADFSVLNNSKEGKILNAILTKNFGLYLDCKASTAGCYLKRMKEYEVILTNIQPFIKSPLDSKKLVEYFWYQVYTGNLEKVKDLSILDADVQFYLKKLNGDNTLINKMKSMDIKGPENRATSSFSDMKKTPVMMPSSLRPDEGFRAPVPQAPSHPMHPNMAQSYQSAPMQPNSTQSYQSAPMQPNSTHSYQSAAPSHPIPTTPIMQKPTFKAPTPSAVPMANNYSQQLNQASYQKPSVPIVSGGFQKPPILTSLTGFSQSSIPTAPSSLQQASAPQPSFPCPPKSPFSGTMPMNPLRSGSFSGMPSPGLPMQSKPSYPSPPMQQKPLSPTMNIQNVTTKSREGLAVENPDLTVSKFDQLVAEVRQKAALNNSMILKQRKTQFLNALNAYDGLDKRNIPSAILYCMDLLTKRIEAGGNNLKPDVSLLVEGYSDVVWLRAFVELVKMVY